MNILLAISPLIGICYVELHRGATTALRVDHFLDNLQRTFKHDKGMVVVMDNASVHNGAQLDELHEVRKLPVFEPKRNVLLG